MPVHFAFSCECETVYVVPVLQCLGFHQHCCIQCHRVPHDCSTFTSSIIRSRYSSASKDKSRLFRHAFWTENVQGLVYSLHNYCFEFDSKQETDFFSVVK